MAFASNAMMPGQHTRELHTVTYVICDISIEAEAIYGYIRSKTGRNIGHLSSEEAEIFDSNGFTSILECFECCKTNVVQGWPGLLAKPVGIHVQHKMPDRLVEVPPTFSHPAWRRSGWVEIVYVSLCKWFFVPSLVIDD